MARGRRPQPEAVKAAKGNTGRRPSRNPPVATVEPSGSGGRLPGWLDTQKRVRKVAAQRASKLAGEIWAFLQPELSRMNLVKSTDDIALGRFCRYMAEWIEYTHVLDQEGTFYITSSPHVGELRRPHPAFKQRKDIEGHLKDLGDVLGLSPSARQRLMMQLANHNGLNPQQPPFPSTSEGGDQLPGMDAMTTPIGMLGSRTVN
jgi:P27 family predicted phage terminase small subunit